jgi:hypothetical protein
MEKVSSKIKKYQKILATYVESLAEERNLSLGSSKGYQPVTDFIHNQFQLIQVNWIGSKYAYKVLLHLSIHPETGNIWVLQNNTELDLDQYFQNMNIPKSSIVLGFRPLEMRALSNYAVC